MKKTILLPFLSSLILALLLAVASPEALAKSPWQWRMSLAINTPGNAMLMPTALYMDESRERYYVADSGNNRLLSFDRNGALLHTLNAEGQLETPYDMTRTESGDIWVVEKGRNSLTLIDLKARTTETHTLYNGERLVFPDRLLYRNGEFYVLDRASGAILVYGPDLKAVKRTYACDECQGGLVDFIVSDDALWALDMRGKQVVRFGLNGDKAATISLGDDVYFPVSLAVGPSGFIYILDRHEGAIAAYDRNGRFKYRFLGQGQAQGQLYYPLQLRFDPWGQLCVVDEGNGRVEVFSR